MQTLRFKVDMGVMAMKGYSRFSKPPKRKPRHQMAQCHIQDTRWLGAYPFRRDAVDVFYSPTRLGHRTLVGSVLFLSRKAVSVFYRPSWLGHKTLVVGRSYPFAEMQSVYSTGQPTGLQNTGWRDLTPLQKSIRCILQTQPTGPQNSHCRAFFPFCWDAVGVFNSSSRLG